MTEVRWHHSIVDEDRLVRDYGVNLTRDTLALDTINWQASLHNQNRPVADVDKQHVEDIAVAMANGHLIPAIVVRQNGRGVYVLDGNHRATAAQQLGETDIDVWFVDCTDDTADQIAEFANISRHGKGVSLEHRMHVCEKYAAEGVDLDRVARLAGVKRATLDNYRMRARAERKIERTLGDKVKKPSHNQAAAINRLEDDELKVLGVQALDVPPKQLDTWTKQIAATPSSERMAATHEVKGQIKQAQTQGTKKATPFTEARRGISTLRRNLRPAMDDGTKQQADELYDGIHELWMVAKSLRDGS